MRRLSLLVLAVYVLGACTAVRRVPKRELERRDGFVHEERSLFDKVKSSVTETPAYERHDAEGQAITFDAETRLVLGTRVDTPYERIVEQRYRKVSVSGGTFRGEPMAALEPVVLPL